MGHMLFLGGKKKRDKHMFTLVLNVSTTVSRPSNTPRTKLVAGGTNGRDI